MGQKGRRDAFIRIRILANEWFDDGRGDSPRFLTAYSPPRPSTETLEIPALKNHHREEKWDVMHIITLPAAIVVGVVKEM